MIHACGHFFFFFSYICFSIPEKYMIETGLLNISLRSYGPLNGILSFDLNSILTYPPLFPPNKWCSIALVLFSWLFFGILLNVKQFTVKYIFQYFKRGQKREIRRSIFKQAPFCLMLISIIIDSSANVFCVQILCFRFYIFRSSFVFQMTTRQTPEMHKSVNTAGRCF